jgi:hypothetical protein
MVPVMTDLDPAELERIRRHGRADWRRLVAPGWERGLTPEQMKAQRKDFAKWERAFETPLARRLRKQQEEREQEEQERLEREHQAEIEREVLKLKAEIAALRFELVWAEFCSKTGFNPDQPRVPAGNSDGGQWTSGAAAVGDSAAIGNDESSNDGDADATPQLVQDRADRLLNSHIIENHVTKTDEELKARIRESQWRGLSAGVEWTEMDHSTR